MERNLNSGLQLLSELKANEIPHSGRTLYDHLTGVYNLLKEWDYSDDCALAGLFHSIYGTVYFKRNILNSRDMANRKKIVNAIGDYPECLVYLFCTTQHPRLDMFKSLPYSVLANDLIGISAANSYEQKHKFKYQEFEMSLTSKAYTAFMMREVNDCSSN